MPFAKGQSGNPGGRPKESDQVKRLAREHTVEAINKLVEWMRGDNARASVSACTALLDRGYGKPTQAVDHQGLLNYDALVLALLNGSTVETENADGVPAVQ